MFGYVSVLSGDTRSASFGLLFRMKTAIKMEPAQFIGLYNGNHVICHCVYMGTYYLCGLCTTLKQRVTKGNLAIMTSS
ncbi:hypothetical protein T12_3166 [Trichinella patagoniensis]|uniref:Uncharacterized protein n=1 Tax=Trichinella patagoniensis TaxID=990121 RepID=A0A0V0ZR83_9BILA|nr:hypothetical protein T12_3166 [Trichinella patagoniensis]